MKKQDIISSLRTYVGGGDWISRSEIARWMRVSRSRIPDLVEGLSALGRTQKRYFIPDVADRIMKERRGEAC